MDRRESEREGERESLVWRDVLGQVYLRRRLEKVNVKSLPFLWLQPDDIKKYASFAGGYLKSV